MREFRARRGLRSLVEFATPRSFRSVELPTLCMLACVAAPSLLSMACAAPAAPPASKQSEKEPTAIVLQPFGPPAPANLGGGDKPLRVIVGGDLIPHRPSLAAPASIGAALAPLAPVFGTADIVVANYEAATGAVDKKGFRLAYAAPPEWLAEVSRAGIGAVTVANNHACDLGIEGVEATLEAAEAGGTVAIGGDAKDPWAARTLAERGGKKVCAIGWTTLVNAEGGCARTVRLAVATHDRKGIASIDTAFARAKSTCDATIAIIHGGEEYKSQTSAMLEQAKHAADAGAAAVVIHHPHIASPVVIHTTKDGRSVPVFASVGNLVSNQGESWKPPMYPVLRQNRRLVCVNGWTRLGVLADLAFAWDDGQLRLDWGYHLTWTENEHAGDKSIAVPKIEARLLDPEKDAEIVTRLSDDEVGPVDLFEDPCWIERPIYSAGDAARDPRCSALSPKAAMAAPAPVAARSKRRRR